MTVEVVEGSISHVIISVPRKRNALSLAVLEALTEKITRLSSVETVRAIVISGAEGAFSSGADLKEQVTPQQSVSAVSALYEAIRQSPKPIIARVEGFCFGLAVGVAAACDLVVVAENTRFALPEPRFSQAPTLAAITIMQRVSRGAAARIMLASDDFDGREALDMGLADLVAPQDRLEAVISELIDSILLGDPTALAVCKRLCRVLPGLGPAEVLQFAGDLTTRMSESSRNEEAK